MPVAKKRKPAKRKAAEEEDRSQDREEGEEGEEGKEGEKGEKGDPWSQSRQEAGPEESREAQSEAGEKGCSYGSNVGQPMVKAEAAASIEGRKRSPNGCRGRAPWRMGVSPN